MNGFWFTDEQQAIRDSVLRLCADFDAEYWRRTDETGDFPEAFVAAMAAGGWLGAAMPVELGGSGLGLTEAAIAMQAVAESGAGFSGASALHLNIFGPMPLARFGTEEQKQRLIPRLISGEDRMCFGVTEPDAGLDTTSLTTRAVRTNDGYVIEAKAPRRDGRIDLSGWLREAELEADNYRIQKRLVITPAPLVIIKASNRGIGDAYVVQRLSSALPKL
jgi:acyl-CoA dehydrogenase